MTFSSLNFGKWPHGGLLLLLLSDLSARAGPSSLENIRPEQPQQTTGSASLAVSTAIVIIRPTGQARRQASKQASLPAY